MVNAESIEHITFDKSGVGWYRGFQIKRVSRRKMRYARFYFIGEDPTTYDSLEVVVEEIDYMVERRDRG